MSENVFIKKGVLLVRMREIEFIGRSPHGSGESSIKGSKGGVKRNVGGEEKVKDEKIKWMDGLGGITSIAVRKWRQPFAANDATWWVTVADGVLADRTG